METISHRREQITGLDPEEFKNYLRGRLELIDRVSTVVTDAVERGEIEAWSYPEIEAALGMFASTILGSHVASPAVLPQAMFSTR